MSRGTPFDLVIFDLDGTLVDSLPDIAAALNATRREAGHPDLPVDAIERFVGDGAARLIARAFATDLPDNLPDSQSAALLARFMAFYSARVCVKSRLYPGIREMVTALGEAGVTLAVLTNKPGTLARELLEALGLRDRFRDVIGDGDGSPRKPDATAARLLMARAGVPAERTAVVGDGIPDLRMASAIPCHSIAAAWGYSQTAVLVAEHPSFLAASVEEAWRILSKSPA
jgi:phosphoglycolate phosphatase